MKEPLIYKGSCGGRNRTRTCDPIDVNDVLYLCGLFSQLFYKLCAFGRDLCTINIELDNCSRITFRYPPIASSNPFQIRRRWRAVSKRINQTAFCSVSRCTRASGGPDSWQGCV